MNRNILLTIQYDGTDFAGWQRQPSVSTVQGEIEKALSMLCACDIEINGTSRTDAGVHALGQRASFSGDFKIPTENIKFALNNALPKAIHILEAKDVDEDFHARFDSKGKTYRYEIANGGEEDPFRRNYCYYVKDELDLGAMKQAASHIVGTHDFACFQAAGGQLRETTVRTIHALDIKVGSEEKDSTEVGGKPEQQSGLQKNSARNITITVTGDGFLYNMVRIIVGTLVDVGKGKIAPDKLVDIIEGKDRTAAGHTAPPQGLYLQEIYY